MLAAAAVPVCAQNDAAAGDQAVVDSTPSFSSIPVMSDGAFGPSASALSADSSASDSVAIQTFATSDDSAATADTTARAAPNSDSGIAATVAAPPPAASAHYYGQAVPYSGSGRGIVSHQPAGRTVRARIADTAAPPPTLSVDNATVVKVDGSPAQLPEAESHPTGPPSSYKAPRRAKIVAALIATTAIGGLTAFILSGRLSDAENENVQRIPDPPPPPEF